MLSTYLAALRAYGHKFELIKDEEDQTEDIFWEAENNTVSTE